MQGKKTGEQDWEDSFPFLQKPGLEAPFLFALCHARSLRHLRSMLSEWLPPNWRLSRDEVIAMERHWSKWYEGGQVTTFDGHDSLVRSAMSRLTRLGPSLREHYLEKIEEAFGQNEDRWAGIMTRLVEPVGTVDIGAWVELFGSLLPFSLYLRPTSPDMTVVLACIGIGGHRTSITEPFTHAVLQMSRPAFTRRDFEGLQLVYELDADSTKAMIIGLAHTHPSIEGSGKLVDEAVVQLNNVGVPVIRHHL